ncbi:hypothetical protein ACCAA_1110026 [Candidatus Accumulibacter aalborgensis]|uniref:Uncharacterized protein n=1 Tax=Candidatus Accumulibacter aalborgensis TaxID=1860102 RepID=A0A1A8XH88_9PROT|nr:hypothetical protein ACCAA_1110026 [Candidatus Accumulibacter aalborgensis]
MNRAGASRRQHHQRVPRARGDEPLVGGQSESGFGAFPAPAGMNRICSAGSDISQSVPRGSPLNHIIELQIRRYEWRLLEIMVCAGRVFRKPGGREGR